MVKTEHEHQFQESTLKVRLTRGRLTAIDLLKQYKCVCGKTETADIIERKVL